MLGTKLWKLEEQKHESRNRNTKLEFRNLKSRNTKVEIENRNNNLET